MSNLAINSSISKSRSKPELQYYTFVQELDVNLCTRYGKDWQAFKFHIPNLQPDVLKCPQIYNIKYKTSAYPSRAMNDQKRIFF